MTIEKLLKYITSRYIMAAAIFASLSTVLFISHRAISDAIQLTETNHNKLSQTYISFLETNSLIQATVYLSDTSSASLLDSLKNRIKILPHYLFEQEDILWEIKKPDVRKNIAETLAALKIHFDSYLKDLQHLKPGNPEQYDQIKTALVELDKHINDLIDFFAQEKQDNITFYQRINILLWLGSLIILHLVVILIFRPMSRRIKNNIRKIEQKMDAAVSAANAKSEYLATLSHEIRTPLNGVLGLTTLLLDSKLSKEQREYLELVYDSGENLLFVINDVFDFAKIESGNLEIEEMYFSIHSCIENIIGEYSPKAAEKNLELLYFIESDIPSFILGDSYRLRQCLSNLVSNAIKFTRIGEIFIRVNLLSVKDNIYEIQFSVSDTGIGIPEENQKSLFSPFFKKDAPVARRFYGTGLGMAISARLVELMHGRIWVHSEVSKGSTFYIAMHFKAREKSEIELLTEHLAPLSKKHVIILDSNETNRKVIAVHCHNWGMYPKTASDLNEFLQALEQDHSYDFAIIENTFLKKEDSNIIQKIEENKIHKNMQIIIMASQPKKKYSPEDYRYPVLFKPVLQVQLYEKLISLVPDERILDEPVAQTIEEEDVPENSQPLNLLLAEDNLINQKLINHIMSSLGYKIDLANNGFEALKMAQNKNYDIIFMDLQMPEMDGVEATTKILQLYPAGIQPKIIALTANVQKEDKEMCFEAGMVDYISKPVKLDKLRDLLEHWGSVKLN